MNEWMDGEVVVSLHTCSVFVCGGSGRKGCRVNISYLVSEVGLYLYVKEVPRFGLSGINWCDTGVPIFAYSPVVQVPCLLNRKVVSHTSVR